MQLADPRPLRVLFVESGTEMGGAQIALLNMLENLDRGLVDPSYVSLGFGKGDLPDVVRSLGIPVQSFPQVRFRELGRSSLRVAQLARMIRRKKFDLVFSNSGHPLLFARPAAVLTGRPCVWWVHGFFEKDFLTGDLIQLLQLLLGADFLFANSRHTAGVLQRVFPECPAISVVHYGIDTGRFSPNPERKAATRQQLGFRNGEVVLGMFGRLHPFKGQDVVLQALGRLKARHPKMRCLFVGGTPYNLSPQYPSQLRNLVHAGGLEPFVQFLGHRTETQDLMNASDIVIHASIEPEPWGLVVSEAMATGKCVVASAAGGPLEMIEDGISGLLCPPGDAETLANLLDPLIREPRLRHALGEKARKRAQAFDVQAAAKVFCGQLQKAFSCYAASRGTA